jgi:hypothetical protein
MSKNDEEAMRCVEQLIEAMQHLRQMLEKREEMLRQALQVSQPPPEFTVALKDSQITEQREDLNEALFALERCRRESRIASFRSALDHGVSINELSRIWGFSRQMASRYAKEARGELPGQP